MNSIFALVVHHYMLISQRERVNQKLCPISVRPSTLKGSIKSSARSAWKVSLRELRKFAKTLQTTGITIWEEFFKSHDRLRKKVCLSQSQKFYIHYVSLSNLNILQKLNKWGEENNRTFA